MSNNADKKNKHKKDGDLNLILYILIACNLISYILFYFYCDEISNLIYKVVFFTGGCFILFKLISFFYGSMFQNYIGDLLILHCIAMIGCSFHNKFFAVYLSIPGYAVYVGFKWLYTQAKNFDQSPPEEQDLGKTKKIKKSS